MRKVNHDGPPWVTIPNVSASESPALTLFNGVFYLAHQGTAAAGTAGSLLYTTSTDGKNWGPDITIPGVAMSGSPAMAVFNNTLYIAHQGSEDPSQIWYSTSSDGVKWSGNSHIAGVSTSASPSLVSFHGSLYLAYLGNDGKTVWYTQFADSNWAVPDKPVPNVTTPVAPALGVFNGTLYLTYLYEAGVGNYSLMRVSSSDGQSWSSPSTPNIGGTLLEAAPASTDGSQSSFNYAVGFLSTDGENVSAYQPSTTFITQCPGVGSPGIAVQGEAAYITARQSDGSVIIISTDWD